MNRLLLRLMIQLAAAILVGLALLDVAFVAWSQSQLAGQRRLELRVAAQVLAAELRETRTLAPTELALLAEQLGVTLILDDGRGGFLASRPDAPFPESPKLEVYGIVDGWEQFATAAPSGSAWSRVVATRPLGATATKGIALQRAVLFTLLGVGAIIFSLALFFLRRSVLRPLIRITQLAKNADEDGLSRLGHEGSDDMARLSQAILTMSQRMASDREKIKAQLAKLQSANRDLRATQAQLVRAERLGLLGQLAAGLAHEIGNPLAVLSGYVEIMEADDVSQEEWRAYLARMTRELERIHTIIRELLDFSRAPAQAPGRGSVSDALLHVENLLRPQARMREISLDVRNTAGEVTVGMDSNGLTQVFLNLILNAADALGDAGTIRVSVREFADECIVAVEDSGPGVSAELGDKVFEPFFTTKPAGRGTGLGLAVCEHMVGAAGGELRLEESEDLGGARFLIKLPVV